MSMLMSVSESINAPLCPFERFCPLNDAIPPFLDVSSGVAAWY